MWCQAVAVAFLHLSLGHQKATLGSFSGDGSSRLGHLLGWNPAGVRLFRMHADRRPSGPMVLQGFWTVSKLLVMWCQAVAVAFLHLSLGPQKATLESFSVNGSIAGWATFWVGILLGFGCFACMPTGAARGPWFLEFLNGFAAACYVMSGSGGGLSSSFFRASESNVREFFGGWFSQVGPPFGLESCWGSAVSHACSWTVSKLLVMWCQAVAVAFPHLTLGPQKATLESFSGDGSSRLGHLLGWNRAGVWLFHMHADRRPSGLLKSIQRRPKRPPKLPFQLRPLHVFAGVLNGFEAACYVMSGSGGGLSSSLHHHSCSYQGKCLHFKQELSETFWSRLIQTTKVGLHPNNEGLFLSTKPTKKTFLTSAPRPPPSFGSDHALRWLFLHGLNWFLWLPSFLAQEKMPLGQKKYMTPMLFLSLQKLHVFL